MLCGTVLWLLRCPVSPSVAYRLVATIGETQGKRTNYNKDNNIFLVGGEESFIGFLVISVRRNLNISTFFKYFGLRFSEVGA